MLNDFLKEKFNEKIYKVSLDGGFTCPNRDGKVSRGGCIFCSENGSGDFTATKLKSIHAQIEEQIDLVSKKYKGDKYIAYFQNFTNTYAEVSYLRKIYEEALSHEKIVGLAIATRPDCLEDDVLELLAELNKKTFLWVELGLQTLNDDVAYWNMAFVIINGDENDRNSYQPVGRIAYDDFIKKLPKEKYKFIDASYIMVDPLTKEEISDFLK